MYDFNMYSTYILYIYIMLLYKDCTAEYLGYYQCCQVRGFAVELGYFNTVTIGCFSCPWVEATPITWYIAPAMWILPWEPRQKTCTLPPRMQFLPRDLSKNAIGLVLSSNWAGFVVKTWQPWLLYIKQHCSLYKKANIWNTFNFQYHSK